MTPEFSIHSDLLIHWTGKDLDEKLDPEWILQHKQDRRANTGIANAYVDRLRDILKFGLWLTEEDEQVVRCGKDQVTIPKTPKVCFTELKLSQSRRHAKQYGRLGIGLKRPYVFSRGGRPLIYFGYDGQRNSDPFLRECSLRFENKPLLNFFKPMNSDSKKLNDDFYGESEWRVIFTQDLLEKGKLIDPRDPKNEREHAYFNSLGERERERLRFLAPVDGWLSLIIYPSIGVKNRAQQGRSEEIQKEIHRIKNDLGDRANRVEGGNRPMEIDLDACREF